MQCHTENFVPIVVPGLSASSSSTTPSPTSMREVRIWISEVFIYIHFPKDWNCEICQRTKNYKGPMQKTQWRSRTSCRTFWWFDYCRSQGPKWQLRISKQSSICSCGAGSSHSMDPGVSVQEQNFTRNPEKLAKVSWSPRGNQKSFTLTIPWNLAKLVKISPGIIARLHHTDRRLMVLPKEQCAE